MKQDIGKTAGDLWHLLEEKNELSISQIAKQLEQKETVVYQALGWLAREDKVKYESRGRQTIVSLN